MQNEKEDIIVIPKELWQQLMDAYDRQNSKFVSVFKTTIICITVIIVTWLIGYFCLPSVNQEINHSFNNNSGSKMEVNK